MSEVNEWARRKSVVIMRLSTLELSMFRLSGRWPGWIQEVEGEEYVQSGVRVMI